MSVLIEVTEGSTEWVTVSFYDKNGDLEVPSGVTYQIWDVVSGIAIVPETSLPPASQIEIELTPDDNRILDSSHYREARRVIVVSTYAGSQQLTQDFVYHVRNIMHVQLPPPS